MENLEAFPVSSYGDENYSAGRQKIREGGANGSEAYTERTNRSERSAI